LKLYLGIDNGVTGSIAIMDSEANVIYYDRVPTFVQQDYSKDKKNITRIDRINLIKILKKYVKKPCFCLTERPMINTDLLMFTSSIIAARSFESLITVFEELTIPYEVTDSRRWQKKMLVQGLKGDEWKQCSFDTGLKLFPSQSSMILKLREADSLLMAEYARRENL
jgi:hypothetical protein